jgi:hypothetical protein
VPAPDHDIEFPGAHPIDEHRKIELLHVDLDSRLAQLLLDLDGHSSPRATRSGSGKRKLQSAPALLAHAISIRVAPAKRVEQLTGALEIERDLWKPGVGGRVGSHRRTECRQGERIEHAAHDRLPVHGHRKRASQLAVPEESVRTRTVSRVAKVELRERVVESPHACDPELRELGQLRKILRSQRLEDVGFPG